MRERRFKRRLRPPPPPHGFLIEAERVAVVDWGPSGRLHLRRADDPIRLGCSRSAHGTSEIGEDPPERVFGHLAQTGLLCKGCLDAFERSLRVYAAPCSVSGRSRRPRKES